MDTIYSLVTKPINQNVAIIRISGPETIAIIKTLFPSLDFKENKIAFKKLFINKKFVDDVLILMFARPNSFTGEDLVEIQCHGNLYIVEKILSAIKKQGIRQSNRGEFMKQAYMNNKIDLLQSEAINTLITTENKRLANISTQNLNGYESKIINSIIDDLSGILGNIQVNIDYPENEDIKEYSTKDIIKKIKTIKTKIEKVILNSEKLIRQAKGIKIALIGKPNVGKSTLLNSLLGYKRAIVSNVEGTTRDMIEESFFLNGIKLTFQDTAGMRYSDDEIEKEGINFTKKAIKEADIVIIVETEKLNLEDKLLDNKKVIRVVNKKDLYKKLDKNKIYISAKNNDITNLIKEIKTKLKQVDDFSDERAFLISNSQITSFNLVNDSLENVLSLAANNYSTDVIGFEIELALKTLLVLIGKEFNSEFLTNLFSKFCIGK